MQTPLHYQLSEYDCGPTSMLNAVRYLFQREEIPPDLIRNIMLYCLDCYGAEGAFGKSGTSCTAMMFLSNWLNSFGSAGQLSISSRYLAGDQVFLGDSSLINDALRRGGVAVVRLWFDVEHYVLLTGEQEGNLLLFDPYYQVEDFPQPDIRVTLEHPFRYNRVVPAHYFHAEAPGLYSLGEPNAREAVLLFNEDTKQSADRTIEYFI